jgi:hypothetical protein
VHPIADVQIEYSLISRAPEAQIFPLLTELGVGATAYGVLSRGLLSGSTPNAAAGDFRAHLPRFEGENREQNDRLVAELRRPCRERGVRPSQLAIAWVLARGQNNRPGRRRPDARAAGRVLWRAAAVTVAGGSGRRIEAACPAVCRRGHALRRASDADARQRAIVRVSEEDRDVECRLDGGFVVGGDGNRAAHAELSAEGIQEA